MEFEIGFRKWAVLKVGSLSPAGETMQSSLTSMIIPSYMIDMAIIFKKLKSLMKNCDEVN